MKSEVLGIDSFINLTFRMSNSYLKGLSNIVTKKSDRHNEKFFLQTHDPI